MTYLLKIKGRTDTMGISFKDYTQPLALVRKADVLGARLPLLYLAMIFENHLRRGSKREGMDRVVWCQPGALPFPPSFSSNLEKPTKGRRKLWVHKRLFKPSRLTIKKRKQPIKVCHPSFDFLGGVNHFSSDCTVSSLSESNRC